MTQERPGDVETVVRQRLRALRVARGWSLDQLSERTHLSPSTISRLETGGRRLTLDHLRLLAAALDTSIDALVEAPTGDDDVVIRPVRGEREGAVVWPLTRPGAPTEVSKVRLTPARTRREPSVHPGRDWFYVLEGTVLLTLGDREVVVHAGHAADFATMTPHRVEAHGGPAELISILDQADTHFGR